MSPFCYQGIRLGNLLFISGQAGYDADGRIVQGGFKAQGEQDAHRKTHAHLPVM